MYDTQMQILALFLNGHIKGLGIECSFPCASAIHLAYHGTRSPCQLLTLALSLFMEVSLSRRTLQLAQNINNSMSWFSEREGGSDRLRQWNFNAANSRLTPPVLSAINCAVKRWKEQEKLSLRIDSDRIFLSLYFAIIFLCFLILSMWKNEWFWRRIVIGFHEGW